MTPTTDAPVITEALAVIDKALSTFGSRELVSSVEVSDLLLDLRLLLMAAESPAPVAPVAEGVLPG